MDKDQMKMLLEEIRNDVKLALEGHDLVRREIQGAKTELKTDIQQVKIVAEYNAQRLNDLNKKLDSHILQPH
ncbi:MAG: hypothetical protein ABIE84_03540 [bacterium]